VVVVVAVVAGRGEGKRVASGHHTRFT
jgi:hypothetical protein